MALNPPTPQLGMGLTEQVQACQDPPDVNASRALFSCLPLLKDGLGFRVNLYHQQQGQERHQQ